MIKLLDLLKESTLISNAIERIKDLPQGKLFDDAKNIEGIFTKTKRSWSEVQSALEQNLELGSIENVDLNKIHITQPNIQSSKALKKIKNPGEPINAIQFEDGEIVIPDGHHRLVAAWALGEPQLKVNLIKL